MSTEYKSEINDKYDDTSRRLLETAPPYVKSFFDYMESGKAAGTRNQYIRDVLAFMHYEHEVLTACDGIAFKDLPVFIFDKLTGEDIIEYRKFLKSAQFMTASSIKRVQASLSTFYKFLNLRGYIKNNPMVYLDQPKTNAHKIIKLDAELSNRLLTGILCNTMYLTLPEDQQNKYNEKLAELKTRAKEERESSEKELGRKWTKEEEKRAAKDLRNAVNKLDSSFEPIKVPQPIPNNTWIRREKVVLRNYAIATLFLGSGLRVSELVGLDLSDIVFRNNSLTIVKKGGDETQVYFGDDVAVALRAYINGTPLPPEMLIRFFTQNKPLQDWCLKNMKSADFEKRLRRDFPEEEEQFYTEAAHLYSALNRPGRSAANPAPNEKAVFLSNQGKRMTVRMVELMIKEMVRTYLPEYEDKEVFSPHKLRATCATRILTQTGDIDLAATQLNHASIGTTAAFYAEVRKERQKEKIQQLDMTKWE